MDSVGPLRAEYYLETFIDDLGYKYRRKGQPYVKVKDESYSVTYICMIAKCSASLTFNSKTKDFKKSKKFNHKCSITDHMSRTYSTSIRITDIKTLEEKINQDPMKPLPALYEEVTRAGSGFTYSYGTFKFLADQIKQKFFPKLNQAQLFELMGDEKFQGFYQCFLQGECKNIRVKNQEIALIFFNKFGAKRLSENRIFCIDGTFKYCPIGFYQLVSIVSLDEQTNQYVPCCYILMNSKTEQLYFQTFMLIKARLKAVYGYDWIAEVSIMDMELGLQNAFKKTFPDSEIRSCYFHYVKALWSHAANFGLKKKELIRKTRILIQNLKVAVISKTFINLKLLLKK